MASLLENWDANILALPQLFAVVSLVVCFGLLWRRRNDAPGAKEALVLIGSLTWWSLLALLEFCSRSLEAMVLFNRVAYLGVVVAPWALLHLCLAFTDTKHQWPRLFDRITAAMAALVLALVFTDPWTNWFWSSVDAVEVSGHVMAKYNRGPLFGFDFAYCYILMAISVLVLLRHALVSGGIFQRQCLMIVAIILCPWVSSLFFLLQRGPLPYVDYTPVGFAVGGLLLVWSLFRYRLFDLTPVAAHLLFERMVDPVLVIDRQERLIKANRAAMKVFHLDNSRLGQPLKTVFANDPVLLEAFTRREAFEYNGVSWSMETTLLEDSMAYSRGYLCVLRDITELTEARQMADEMASEARRANEAKSMFLAHVSHDLRTPVHAILAMTELVAEGKDPDSPDGRNLAIIRNAGETLLRLVNDLLDINRIESGAIDLEDRPFCLADVMDPIVSLLEPAARRKGLSIDLNVEPGLSRMRGDPDRIRQILFNLVGNAVKFSDQGLITVRATKTDVGWLRVEVADQGPGIDPELLPTIFSPFVRAQGMRKKEGSGLGLTIVRRFTELMGGTVSVRNRPEGGSCFTVELPIIDQG